MSYFFFIRNGVFHLPAYRQKYVIRANVQIGILNDDRWTFLWREHHAEVLFSLSFVSGRFGDDRLSESVLGSGT